MKIFQDLTLAKCLPSAIESECAKVIETYALEAHEVDFKIERINTYKKTPKSPDYQLLPDYEAEELFADDAVYLKKNFEVRQDFDVTITQAQADSIAQKVSIKIDEDAYRLELVLQAGIDTTAKDFFKNLHTEILKKKALAGVIIYVKSDYAEEIAKLESTLNEALNKNAMAPGELAQNLTMEIELARGFCPEIKMEYIDVIQSDWKVASDFQSDLKDGEVESAFFAVKAGDIVGFIQKPKAGQNGRNLFGKYVQMVASAPKKMRSDLESKLQEFQKKFAEHQNPNAPKPEPKKEEEKKEEKKEELMEIKFKDGDFRRADKGEKVEFSATSNGYARINGNALEFLRDLRFTDMSAHDYPPLLGGIDKGLSVEVKGSSDSMDAAGAGVIIEAQSIFVNGSVGERVKLFANNIEITGHTHQSSLIRAKSAQIGIHKGELFCEYAIVKKVEMGVIHAEKIEAQEMGGANVSAGEITIGKLHANCKIAISRLLAILGIDGGENKITIKAGASATAQAKIDSINKDLASLTERTKSLFWLLQKDIFRIKKIKPAIEKFKAVMEQNRLKGIKNDDYVLSNVGQYVLQLRRAERLKNRIEALQKAAKSVRSELRDLEQVTKTASVNCEEVWKKENQIFYEYMFPKPGVDTLLLNEGEFTNISINGNKLMKDVVDFGDEFE